MGALVHSRGDRSAAARLVRQCRHCHEPFEPTFAVQCFCTARCRVVHLARWIGRQRALPIADGARLFDEPPFG